MVVDDNFINRMKQPSSPERHRLEELQSTNVFMYSKIPATTTIIVNFVIECGFKLIDTAITLEKPIIAESEKNLPYEVRFVVSEDKEPVVEIARKSFIYSRFHQDSAFPAGIADKTRAEWVRNYFEGNRGDAMVVAVDGKIIIGFLLLLYGNTGILTIDLIAVAKNFRRKGIARHMIQYAESMCPGFSDIRVGTQLVNLPSLRLYEGMGFRAIQAQYILHYHHKQHE
jgi:ribosomal protein S18 acetylase RimI-like enzyme